MSRNARRSSSPAALASYAVLLLAAGCSSSSEPAQDARLDHTLRRDQAPQPAPDLALADQRAADAARDGQAAAPDQALLPTVSEQEPNDGAQASEYNDVAAPTKIEGAIGQANDADVFRFAASAGERHVVRVQSAADLEVHVAIFGQAPLDVPVVVNRGPGKDGLAEFYVLESGQYFIAVRDRRNVGSSPAGVGGASFGYTVTIEPLTRAPLPAVVGGEVAGQLDPPGSVAVFFFSAAANDELTISAVAQQLAPPSDVDTRLTLFHPGQKAWLGTNDNPALDVTDSRLTGKLPFAGTYHAIVENVADSGSDHRFKLEIVKVGP